MKKQITIPFQITLWDLHTFDETTENQTLSRGTVKKSFASDDLRGESSGEILMFAGADGSAAYTVLDKISGELCGCKGSFLVMHGATHTPEETSRAGGIIVPNSGTGELENIKGTIEFVQNETGKNIILDFTLPDTN